MKDFEWGSVWVILGGLQSGPVTILLHCGKDGVWQRNFGYAWCVASLAKFTDQGIPAIIGGWDSVTVNGWVNYADLFPKQVSCSLIYFCFSKDIQIQKSQALHNLD